MIGLIVIVLCVVIIDLIFQNQKDPIYIAMVGPISGPQSSAGRSILKGINLYLDIINEKGGIHGRKVLLDIFDDQNKPDIAKEQANEIIKINRAVAVIGHHYSSCSIAGGEIYKLFGIPAISPTSTNVMVTKNNDWYFRTVINDSMQSRFLATYAKKVFPENTPVSIIYEELDYGSQLATVFEQTATEFGIPIKYKWHYNPNDSLLDRQLNKIMSELQLKKDAGIIFLASHASEGIKILKLMKDYLINMPVLAPDSFTSESFRQKLKEFPKEKENPGFYTDGMLVTTPMILDAMDETGQHFNMEFKKKYKVEPGWHEAFAFDTTMILVETMQNNPDRRKDETITSYRKRLRNYLAGLTDINHAIKGVTGYNYFDEHGDSQKTVYTGMYKNQNIISTFSQFRPVPNIFEVPDLNDAINEKRILLFDGRYMFKINTVYTGIELISIQDLDIKASSCELEFILWFRYQGDFHPDDIIFLNTMETIDLGKPIKEELQNDIYYKAYKIKGKFKVDSLPNETSIRDHHIGISFRHRSLTSDNLKYVLDVLGMRVSKGSTIVEKLKKSNILLPSSEWAIYDAYFYQDSTPVSSFGSLQYLNVREGTLKFSMYNLCIRIKKNEFTLRGSIPDIFVNNLFVLSIIMLFVSAYVFRGEVIREYPKLSWCIQCVFSIVFLICLEAICVDRMTNTLEPFQVHMIKTGFDVLWWILPAMLLNGALRGLVWIPLEIATERPIPNIVIRSVSFIIYILAFFGIIAYVFDQKLTSLLATSGVVAMIIGLAVQVNISNIFSGIVLNIERPFQIGDWVKIGDHEECKVIDITWRTTRLLTRDDCIISLPNSIASESKVHNFHYPDDIYRYWFRIYINPKESTDRVKKILLDAVMSSDAILRTPEPVARFMGYSEWAAEYLVAFSSKNYGHKISCIEDVWQNVVRNLKIANLEPVFQVKNLVVQKETKHDAIKETDHEPIFAKMFNEVEIFKALSNSSKLYLSQKMEVIHLQPGKSIIRQGDEGDAMYIIIEGVVSVVMTLEDDSTVEIGRLGAGTFFGELSLLTGDTRKASILTLTETMIYKINKADFRSVLLKEPHVEALFRNKFYKQPKLEIPPRLNELIEKEKDPFYLQFIKGIKNIGDIIKSRT